jgi:hypothetical protein
MMENEKICIAAKRTLLFSSASGVWGAFGVIIGEQICNMSLWKDVQLIKLFVAGSLGNTLLALPAAAYHALVYYDSTEDEMNRNRSLEKKSLVWVTLTGGLGSLAGASILCMIDSNEKAISATSVGMVGGLVLGVCSFCIAGLCYAIALCPSGEMRLGHLVTSDAGDVTVEESESTTRMPLLRDIVAIEPDHALAQESLPSLAEVSDMIETQLGIPIENPMAIEHVDEENSDLIEISLQDSPPRSPRVPKSASKQCNIV